MSWLTVMKYRCHKWPRIYSTCRKHFSVLSSFMTYHRVNTTGVTSGAATANPSGEPEFTPVFSSVHVTRLLVLCVCFVDCCLFFCPFLLAIVLFVLRFTHSDYPFGIFNLIVPSCWDLFILYDVQASSLADLPKFIYLIATGWMVWLNVLNGSRMCLTVTIHVV
jgi:hypothetical protein